MEQYKRNINNFKDEILKLKRENELLKHRMETEKMEYEDKMRKLKNRYD